MFIWSIDFRNGFGLDLSLVSETGICEIEDEVVLAETSVFQLCVPFLIFKAGSINIIEVIDD